MKGFLGKNNLIILLVAFALLCLTPLAYNSSAKAEQSQTEIVLQAVDYLDFELTNPKAIYADEEIVAVSCGEKTVFFYDSKIYTKPIEIAGQIYRYGNNLYYSSLSLLRCVEIGVFEEKSVVDVNNKPIASNNFCISDSGRLITLTNSGAIYYQDFEKISAPYSFDEDVELKNVQIANDDYFYFDGEIYLGDNHLTYGKATFFTSLNNTVYFSNNRGIFRIDGQNAVCIYEMEDTVHGVCGYGDDLLFIDGQRNEIMRLSLDGSVKKFLFNVEIETGVSLAFNQTPTSVTVSSDARLHMGHVENGIFTYDHTELSQSPEDYVKLGTVSVYSVLYGRNGYCLVADEFIATKTQNTQITFDKGYVLYDCYTYLLPVASMLTESGQLKKQDVVTIISVFEMNGIDYYLISNDNGKAFVPAGEIKEELLPNSFETEQNKTIVTGKNNTVIALIITLLSTGVFALTLFIVLVKKQYFKL